MTQEQLDELQRLHEAARPWECIERGNVGAAHPLFIVPAKGDGFRAPSDVETKLIWDMRNALPDLLSHVRNLEARVAEINSLCAEIYEHGHAVKARVEIGQPFMDRLGLLLTNALIVNRNTAEAAEAYEKRIRAKVLEDIREILSQLGPFTLRDAFEERLADLEAEVPTRNCGTSAEDPA